MRHFLLLLSCASVLLPASAHAERAAVLPAVGGSAQVAQSERDQARAAVSEALRGEDFTVVAPDVVSRRLGSELAGCTPEARCATRARDALDVDVVVAIALRSGGRANAAGSVLVQLTGVDGVSYEGTADVTESVANAARAALREALSRRALGTGPFLTVRGTAGAACAVDDRPVGTIPMTVRVEPGAHRVRITLAGHAPEVRSVTIEANALASETLEVELRPLGGATGAVELRSEPNILVNVILGGALALGGVLAVISPIHTLARIGQCVDDPPIAGRCTTTVEFGAQSGILFAVGAAALIAGAIVLILQPVTMTVQVSPEQALLSVSGRF